MLTIAVNTERKDVLVYSKEKKLIYNEGLYLYEAKDNHLLLGVGLFEVKSDQVIVHHYTSRPEETHFLLDGVLRAGFNYAAEQGVERGIIPEEFRQEYQTYFQKLNYPNEAVFNIKNFFAKYKNCSHR